MYLRGGRTVSANTYLHIRAGKGHEPISSLPACVRKPTGAPYVRPDIMSHSTAASGSTQAKESRAETMWEWEVKTNVWWMVSYAMWFQWQSAKIVWKGRRQRHVEHLLIFMAYPTFQKRGAISCLLEKRSHSSINCGCSFLDAHVHIWVRVVTYTVHSCRPFHTVPLMRHHRQAWQTNDICCAMNNESIFLWVSIWIQQQNNLAFVKPSLMIYADPHLLRNKHPVIHQIPLWLQQWYFMNRTL